MAQFEIDDDLVALVERLAKPKPFEPFSSALRRVLQGCLQDSGLEDLFAEAKAGIKKQSSPSAAEWAAKVPDLRSKSGLNTWKAICSVLKIETAGDSARRKLRNWVKAHRPSWPDVPAID